MNKDIRFYDTSALLDGYSAIFDSNEFFVISSITLKELETIKWSNTKSEEIKEKARTITKWLKNNPSRYDVVIYTNDLNESIKEYNLPICNDTQILACAYWYDKHKRPDETVFVTNDLSLFNIANLFLGNDCVETLIDIEDNYTGYLDIQANEQQTAELYQNPTNNIFNLLTNQYLILRNSNNEIIDIRVWRNNEYKYISDPSFKSVYFGVVNPYQNDVYQKCLFDSLQNNTITLIKGAPGAGKTYTSLAFLMSKVEKNELDRIVIFCNPIATLNSARLGFYPGTREAKLMDSQIGNLLISKFGGRYAVEQLINNERLILLPLSDIRGYDTSGMRAGIYISEAQNLDKELMKLAIQRIGEDCICIIDGDDKAQVDLPQFSGHNNGMKRVSQVFRGKDMYGEIELKNIYRSRIARIAQEL